MVTAADFGPAVTPLVREVDVDAWEDIYIVGDVHGCRRELETLLETLDPSDDDLVVFVGDLVRKGPDSRGVVELVSAHENFISVRGNNEDKLIHGRKSLESVTEAFDDYLESLPIVVLFDDAMVVHGGIDYRQAFDEHSIEELLNTRSVPPEGGYDGPFWFEGYQGPPRVFFGHTVLDEPVVSEWAVGLDTGCVYGGELTAYDYRNDELISVPAADEYQSRADRKIIEPGDGYTAATSSDGGTATDAPTTETAHDDRHRTTGIADGWDSVPEDVALDDPRLYLNRELSELEFQERVLQEALDDRTPLLERVKFLGILTRNLDEFFMKRIGGLKQQMAADVTELTPDGRTPEEQWAEALEKARPTFERQVACWRDQIRPALAEAGIEVVDHDDLTASERDDLRDYFETSVLPTLTPLTFDPAHPFPFLSNLSLSLAVRTRREGEAPKFSRVKIPENRPRLVRVDDSDVFVPLEQVVAANLELLFPNVDILDYAAFRVTRNAEVRRNEEVAEGLIEMIEGVVRDRRFATIVRLEVEAGMHPEVRELLVDQLELDEREVFERPGPLDFRDLLRLTDVDRPDLSRPSWTPKHHPSLARLGDDDRSVFEVLRGEDVLVHHPYHSFEETVQSFFEEAAQDDDVLAIKAAIYRTSHDSKVIQSLIEAARNGKQVAVMVELKARFDEENNLRWVRRLEEEGIHVAYGTIGLKTHSKIALVVRDEPDGVTLYSHVGTGNYHAETAKTYVDLGLLTADQAVGQDLTRVFNFFTGHSFHEEYRKLLVAPVTMRESFVEHIRREAEHARNGDGGRIVAKMNALEDPGIVRELYEASQAGVDIDLIVRGISRLRPGLEGISENIRVRSVVGRFLEHSRLWYFENGGEEAFYIGSADWMTRNLDRRVEAVVPVESEPLREELRIILETMLADNRTAWEMQPDGSYIQCRPGADDVVNTHEVFMARAARNAPHRESREVHDTEVSHARDDGNR